MTTSFDALRPSVGLTRYLPTTPAVAPCTRVGPATLTSTSRRQARTVVSVAGVQPSPPDVYRTPPRTTALLKRSSFESMGFPFPPICGAEGGIVVAFIVTDA